MFFLKWQQFIERLFAQFSISLYACEKFFCAKKGAASDSSGTQRTPPKLNFISVRISSTAFYRHNGRKSPFFPCWRGFLFSFLSPQYPRKPSIYPSWRHKNNELPEFVSVSLFPYKTTSFPLWAKARYGDNRTDPFFPRRPDKSPRTRRIRDKDGKSPGRPPNEETFARRGESKIAEQKAALFNFICFFI